GYAGASTAAVCREAGISSGAFFHYFPTKASLLIAILEQSSHETREFFDEREDRADPVGVIWEYVDHELSSLEDPRAAGFIAAVGGPVPNDDVVAILREVDQRTREGLTGWVSKAQQAGVVRTDLSAERMASWIMLFINGFADQIGGADDFDAVVEKPLLREVLSGFLTGPPSCSCRAQEPAPPRRARSRPRRARAPSASPRPPANPRPPAIPRPLRSLRDGHELHRGDRGVAVLADRDHAHSPDEGGQGLRVLAGVGEDDLEAEVAEGFHRGGDELAGPLGEGLVDDDRGVARDLLAGAGQLVAQRRGQAEGGQALVLAARERTTGLVGVDHGALDVDLLGVEVDVAAHIEDRPGDLIVLGAGRADQVHQMAQGQEALLRQLAVAADVVQRRVGHRVLQRALELVQRRQVHG